MLVVDIGGSLKVLLLNYESNAKDQLSQSEDRSLGGAKIDEILVKHCLDKFQEQTGIDLTNDLQAKRKLAIECEKAKIALSLVSSTTIYIDEFYQQHELYLELTQQDLEQLMQPVLEGLQACIERTIEASDVEIDIQKVLLIGGCARIPCIKKQLESHFEIEPIVPQDPDQIVLHGAIQTARILAGHSGQQNQN